MTRFQDRRRARRIAIRFDARLSTHGAQPITNLPAPVADMSGTGLLLKTPARLVPHRMVTIEAECDGVRYRTRGRIVRVTESADGSGWLVGIELDPAMLEENPFPTSVLVTHQEMPELYPAPARR